MKENQLERYLVAKVKIKGGETRKVQWVGHRGAPDRVCFFPRGKTAWVELKTKTGIVSTIQQHEHAQLAKLGHTVHIMRTVGDIDKLVKEYTQ